MEEHNEDALCLAALAALACPDRPSSLSCILLLTSLSTFLSSDFSFLNYVAKYGRDDVLSSIEEVKECFVDQPDSDNIVSIAVYSAHLPFLEKLSEFQFFKTLTMDTFRSKFINEVASSFDSKVVDFFAALELDFIPTSRDFITAFHNRFSGKSKEIQFIEEMISRGLMDPQSMDVNQCLHLTKSTFSLSFELITFLSKYCNHRDLFHLASFSYLTKSALQWFLENITPSNSFIISEKCSIWAFSYAISRRTEDYLRDHDMTNMESVNDITEIVPVNTIVDVVMKGRVDLLEFLEDSFPGKMDCRKLFDFIAEKTDFIGEWYFLFSLAEFCILTPFSSFHSFSSSLIVHAIVVATSGFSFSSTAAQCSPIASTCASPRMESIASSSSSSLAIGFHFLLASEAVPFIRTSPILKLSNSKRRSTGSTPILDVRRLVVVQFEFKMLQRRAVVLGVLRRGFGISLRSKIC